MSQADGSGNKPIDWSKVESRMVAKSSSNTQSKAYPVSRDVDRPLSVPETIAVNKPNVDTPQGILMRFQKNAIDRKAALDAMKVQHNAQLDALRFQLSKAVSVANARADRIAEEFLSKLDAEHLQVLTNLGLRNAETRAAGLIQLRQMIATKLAEVQEKQWPQPLIERTIDDMLELERRVHDEMMKELGT